MFIIYRIYGELWWYFSFVAIFIYVFVKTYSSLSKFINVVHLSATANICFINYVLKSSDLCTFLISLNFFFPHSLDKCPRPLKQITKEVWYFYLLLFSTFSYPVSHFKLYLSHWLDFCLLCSLLHTSRNGFCIQAFHHTEFSLFFCFFCLTLTHFHYCFSALFLSMPLCKRGLIANHRNAYSYASNECKHQKSSLGNLKQKGE